MNKTIYDISLLDILPESLRSDPDMIAAAKSLDTGFLVVAEKAKDLVIIPRVHEQPEDILDHLAYYLKVDFYEQSLNIETKRTLVQDSVYSHQIKGTPFAVELLIQTLFEEGEVEEWFDYGGARGKFRVVTPNQSVTQERATEFIRAVDMVKRKSAHLDTVIIIQRENMDLFWGGIIHEGSNETYIQEAGD